MLDHVSSRLIFFPVSSQYFFSWFSLLYFLPFVTSQFVAALESRTWHPKEVRCYSQEKEKNLNRQIFPLSPNNL